MDAIHQTVRVEFRYSVHFTRGIFHPGNGLLRSIVESGGELPRKLLFVVDEQVAASFPTLLDEISEYCRNNSAAIDMASPPLTVPGGEMVKNSSKQVERIQNAINEHRICRHSFVVAVGGGAVLDMVGYAAAISHRGVRLIRIPTTVLSQCDSGVGVKTSINFFGKKNFLGTFTPPYAVVNDFDFLDSLCDRDWRGGIAEAVKVALIKDPAFFDRLEECAAQLVARDTHAMEYVVHRCAQLHLDHIAGKDPFETGSSRPLDFGHWAAHKLEQISHYRLRHGEAVAIGIALDSTYSYLTGMLSEAEWRRVLALLRKLGFSLYTSEMGTASDVLRGLAEFREHLGGELTIMLLEGVGRGVEVHEMRPEIIVRSMMLLNKLTPRKQRADRVIQSADQEDIWKSKAPARLQ
jgi:3-dehydroquinate synthase